MKLSIWQQFSSNHSAIYAVVGRFSTDEEALRVAQITKDVLMDIMVSYESIPHDFPSDMLVPTPEEQKVGDKYGFDWEERLDWLMVFHHQRKNPFKYIHTWRNFVFIESPNVNTWQTGHQFSKLFQALGGQTMRSVFEGREPDDSYGEASISHTLTCVAPTEKKAIEIEQKLALHIENQKLRGKGIYIQWEWLPFHPYFESYTSGFTVAEVLEHELLWIQELTKWVKFYNSSANPYKKHKNDLNWQKQRRQWRDEHWARFIKQDDNIRSMINRLREETAIQFGSAHLERFDNTLTLHFDWLGNLITMIPTLVNWLEHEDCGVKHQFEDEWQSKANEE